MQSRRMNRSRRPQGGTTCAEPMGARSGRPWSLAASEGTGLPGQSTGGTGICLARPGLDGPSSSGAAVSLPVWLHISAGRSTDQLQLVPLAQASRSQLPSLRSAADDTARAQQLRVSTGQVHLAAQQRPTGNRRLPGHSSGWRRRQASGRSSGSSVSLQRHPDLDLHDDATSGHRLHRSVWREACDHAGRAHDACRGEHRCRSTSQEVQVPEPDRRTGSCRLELGVSLDRGAVTGQHVRLAVSHSGSAGQARTSAEVQAGRLQGVLEAVLDDRAASELHDLADARLGDYPRQSAVACLNDADGVYFCFCLLLFLGLFA